MGKNDKKKKKEKNDYREKSTIYRLTTMMTLCLVLSTAQLQRE